MQNMESKLPRILIVEDDHDLAEWMREYLSTKEFEVSVAHNGEDGVSHIQRYNPDIVILDGMLPQMDGFDVCKAVRPVFTNGIIMVTARDEEIDEVLGLEMGADEYLTKPLRARALLTRIRKQLEKQQLVVESFAEQTNTTDEPNTLTFDNLFIDRKTMTVTLCGESVKVSTTEFSLLWILAMQAGRIVSRSDVISELRGFDYNGFDRSIDLKVSRLRKKLGDSSAEPTRIKTAWGKGYLFVQDAWGN